MSTCTHCGEYFKPKYRNMKLCFNCWQKRETAFKQYDSLLLELHDLRGIASQSQHGEAIPVKRVRQLLGLCHPDRHHDTPRESTAKEVTQWLNELRRSA